MRASEITEYDDDPLLSGREQRNWMFVGLVLSLLLHGALCFYFYQTRFQMLQTDFRSPVPPPMFKVRNVDLNALEKAGMDPGNAAAKPEPDNTDVQLPDEKKSFDKLLEEVQASAVIPDDTSDVLPERPQVEQAPVNSLLPELERATAQILSNSPNANREQTLLNDSETSGRPQPALTGTELSTSSTIKRPNTFTKFPGDSAGPNRSNAPGFSDLDSLLSQKGPLGSGTAIRLPSDPLYAYDSAELQQGSISELQKLAVLIKRNPKATFSIQGYSDSFGAPEYNLDLSQRRADSVAQYLVEVLGINPAQISTRGFGSFKLLVQPRPVNYGNPQEVSAEIARQHPNRRVVIVVNTNAQ